jgi:hypothetical protein
MTSVAANGVHFLLLVKASVWLVGQAERCVSRCPLLVEFGAVNLWTRPLPLTFGHLI